MNNYFLYIFTVLIWGSTWLAIKFQLGDVDPMISVTYRFTLAALLLLAYCKIIGLKMNFTVREHLFIPFRVCSCFPSIIGWSIWPKCISQAVWSL